MSRAAQACTTCRKQKRKCDKALPACSRCASLQRTCDYSEATGAAAASPTAEEFASLQRKLAEIEARLDATRATVHPHGSQHHAHAHPLPGAHDTPGLSSFAGRPESSPDDVAMETATWSGGELRMNGYAERLFVENKFPSVLFLDSDVYNWAGVTIPKPTVDIPMGVLAILASNNVIEDAASKYFDTIHRWFPFISRIRMSLGFSLHNGGPDLALLFLTMKLITTPPSPDLPSAADSHLYIASKHFLSLLESAGTVSILYLQAMILTTLYEMGHGIYPAAWMTAGSSVRYAAMLGLPSYHDTIAVLGPCKTWTEAEERRRSWWAVHILDRIISLGSRRPFAGGPDTPPEADFLPVDDRAWDAGDMARSLQRPVGGGDDDDGDEDGQRSTTSPFGPFARLAQASMLTSKAMAHCRRALTRYARSKSQKKKKKEKKRKREEGAGGGDSPGGHADGGVEDEEKPIDVRDATEVITELKALCDAIQADRVAGGGGPLGEVSLALAPAQCLLWSTVITVLDLYSCPEHMRQGGAAPAAGVSRTEGELAMQVEAINGLNMASGVVRVFAGELLAIVIEGSLDRVSPLCFDALYGALATFHWQWKESGQPEMRQGMDETRAALAGFASRWRLAGEYLKIERRY